MPPRKAHTMDLETWSSYFHLGADFFGELDHLDLTSARAERKAAQEAWQRLGAAFMKTWEPSFPKQPWALKRFGAPPGYDDHR